MAASSHAYGMRFLSARWSLPKRLTHLVVYGQTGTGKSQTLKSCAERAYLRGVKIVDLYSGGAGEELYWSLASNHSFWKDRKFSQNNQITEAREFPVKALIPVAKYLPPELPDICRVFTIPLSTLKEADLKAVLGNTLTRNELALWRNLQDKIKKDTTLVDLMNWIIDANKKQDSRTPGIHGTGVSSLFNMFSAFKKNMLLSSENNPLSIDIKAELRDRKTVTSLCLKWFPEEYWGFIINHFIHRTYELILKGEIKHPVIIILREVGDFLVNASESSPQEEAIKRSMTTILRKGRKHRLYFWCDNQTPMNLDIIKTQFPVKICHYVDNIAELENALGDLGSLLLTREDYVTLRNFPPGRCYVLEQRGLFNPQMFPPLSRMSGEDGADFLEIWRKEKGARFIQTKPIINQLKEEFKTAEDRWDQVLAERKAKEKALKEAKDLQKQALNTRTAARVNPANISTPNEVDVSASPISVTHNNEADSSEASTDENDDLLAGTEYEQTDEEDLMNTPLLDEDAETDELEEDTFDEEELEDESDEIDELDADDEILPTDDAEPESDEDIAFLNGDSEEQEEAAQPAQPVQAVQPAPAQTRPARQVRPAAEVNIDFGI